MRHILFICLFSISIIASADTPLSSKLLSTIKADKAPKLLELLGENKLDNCLSHKKSSYTPLALTIKLGASESFKTLIDKNVGLEKTCSSKTPLMYAAKYDRLAMFEALVNAGADHSYKNKKGRSAKDYSKKYKRKQIYLYIKSLESENKDSVNMDKIKDW